MLRFRAREPVSGYTHLGGLLLGSAGAIWLLTRAESAGRLLPLAVYAASLIALFAASSAYHLVPGSEALTRRLRKLDHSAIFLFIAGTCTPVFVRAFEGATLVWMLGAAWGLAALGIAARVTWMGAPRALYTLMYVALGWLVVVEGRTALHALPLAVVVLVAAGGLTYMAGALVYATKRPDPVPGVFGFHEIWHIFVLGGSALHYAAITALS